MFCSIFRSNTACEIFPLSLTVLHILPNEVLCSTNIFITAVTIASRKAWSSNSFSVSNSRSHKFCSDSLRSKHFPTYSSHNTADYFLLLCLPWLLQANCVMRIYRKKGNVQLRHSYREVFSFPTSVITYFLRVNIMCSTQVVVSTCGFSWLQIPM
jgi:hypothetical protein